MATGSYAAPKDPGKLVDAKLKEKFKEACVELVRIAPPDTFGIYDVGNTAESLKEYVSKLLGLLDQKPYLMAELVKEDKQTVRLTYKELDKKWVEGALEEAAKTLRFKQKKVEYTAFSSRIVPGDNKAWMEFRTVDCVFAAILAVLGFKPGSARVDLDKLKVKDKGSVVEQSEQAEQAAEDWLAKELNFSRRVTPDVSLIYLLEEQFQWKRVSDGDKVSEFKKNKAAPSSFIISYQQNGDQWHTVYVDHPSTSAWNVTDRQASAKTAEPKLNETGLCDAWQVDKTTPGFQELQKAWDSH